jgi:phosphoglycolate phosphatase
MLEEILSECFVTVDQAVMVGDSVSDVEMARQIGMDVVGFDFYHQNTADLLSAGALKVFDNYQDLGQFLKLS